MLVLSRKPQERLIINGNIVLTIVRVSGGTVRLGIDAPQDIPIQREEVASRQQSANPAHLDSARAD